MSEYGDELVYPRNAETESRGLTKREHFAALAMQGLLARPAEHPVGQIEAEAVRHADALLAALKE